MLEQNLLRYQTLMMSGAYKHIFILHATRPQHFSTPRVNFKSYYVINYMEPRGDAQLHIIMTSNLMDKAISYAMFMFTFTL